MDVAATVHNVSSFQAAFHVLSALHLTEYLWPPSARIKDGATFDFIVVGAGAAGCVIANRLTEIEGVHVLLIEAGGDPPMESVVGLQVFMKGSQSDWNYISEEDETGRTMQHLMNKRVELTRGKMLGGSSSINVMAYTRGNRHDYDTWAAITNDSSWSWNEVLPYFVKSEKLEDPIILQSSHGYYHGTQGPMGISKTYNIEAIDYLQSFAEIGTQITLDTNSDNPFGVSEAMFAISNGVRQSSAYAFLTKIKRRPNLYILKNTLVTKVIFNENKIATGVEALLPNNELARFYVRKEVIVAAGALNTPQLLMLSGIGPKNHLISKGINVISNLPVGQNLKDHLNVLVVHKMGEEKETKPTNPFKFTNPLLISFTALNKQQTYPDYETMSFILRNRDDGFLLFCSIFFGFEDKICQEFYDQSKGRQIFLTLVSQLYPHSSGKVLLRSIDPRDPPLVYLEYYTQDIDLEENVKFIEDYLPIANTSFFKSVDSKILIPKSCGCSETFGKQFWRCYVLCLVVTGYHYAGTCAMGAVVDSALRVYGVRGLRVADASVMPTIVGANTCAPTIMIGEKISDVIKQLYY